MQEIPACKVRTKFVISARIQLMTKRVLTVRNTSSATSVFGHGVSLTTFVQCANGKLQTSSRLLDTHQFLNLWNPTLTKSTMIYYTTISYHYLHLRTRIYQASLFPMIPVSKKRLSLITLNVVLTLVLHRKTINPFQLELGLVVPDSASCQRNHRTLMSVM